MEGCHGNDWSMLGQVPCVSLCRETKGESKRERRSAVLPVAVGHGIVILFLLKELSDGQQLFQHVLLCSPLVAQGAEVV